MPAPRDPLLLDLPLSIDTPRLALRVPQAGDGAALHDALAESVGELRRYLGHLTWVAAEPSVESAEAWCRKGRASFLSRADLPFLIVEKDGGAVVGACGLHRTVWDTPRTEVGYWGRTSRSGQGFVSEAVRALCRYAFDHIGAVRVELVTDDENAGSRRIAERCGFALEGVMRHAQRSPAGTLRNLCMYARFPHPQAT